MSNIRRKKSAQFGSNSRLAMPTHAPSVNADRSTLDPIAKNRIAGVWIVLGMGAVGLLLRLVWLQTIDSPRLQAIARARQSTTVTPFVPRRTIVDRANNQVAIDRPSYTLYAFPAKFGEVIYGKGLPKNGRRVRVTPGDVAQRLAPILESTPAELIKKFERHKNSVRLGSGLREDIKNRIAALKLEGLDLVQGDLDYTRSYPQADMMAEVLGYLDWEHKAQAGVELSQSLLLERKVARYQVTKTGKGKILPDRVTPDYLHTDDLQLRLTVDLRLQRAARTALMDKMKEWHAFRGTVIVMDAETGALRALVVAPTYDPNHFDRAVAEYGKIVGKKRAPTLLQNAAVSDLYEPGSTF